MLSKESLLKLLKKEYATTLRVMRAFPTERADFTPHERSSDALKLMKTFVFEMYLLRSNIFGDEVGPDAYASYSPGGIAEVIANFEEESSSTVSRFESLPDSDLSREISFAGRAFAADEFTLMMLCDQIHHRGQLTVYVRMAGGQVPSIYGPSADDKSTNL